MMDLDQLIEFVVEAKATGQTQSAKLILDVFARDRVREYQRLAHITESMDFHPIIVRLRDPQVAACLRVMLVNTINHGHFADKLKRHIFYGKEDSNPPRCGMHPVPPVMKDTRTVRLLHAVIGMITEIGELAEQIKRHVFDGGELDYTNLQEELGDNQWYVALAHNAIGRQMEETQALNIAKLRKRFGDKFTEHAALNRDLVGERGVLEGGRPVESKSSGEDVGTQIEKAEG